MNIRAMRPTDLVMFLSLQGSGSCTEVTASPWPRVRSSGDHLKIWGLLSHALTNPASGRKTWIVHSDGALESLAVARCRKTAVIWEVEHLLLRTGCEIQGSQLLEHASNRLALRGARKLFLRAHPQEAVEKLARKAGFQRSASEHLYVADRPSEIQGVPLLDLSPQEKKDFQPLFSLYNAAVPMNVRMAEAMTFEEFSALHVMPAPWMEGPGVSRSQYVRWHSDRVDLWLQIASGRKSDYMELLVHPGQEEALESAVTFGLSRLAPFKADRPVYVAVRDYQGPVMAALEKMGFRRAAEHSVFVRQLASRVPERALLGARASLGG